MTLGGLALAVGVLVDEATVEIENIHTHMAGGHGDARVPLSRPPVKLPWRDLLSMLCILAVFVPSFFMAGVGAAAIRAVVAGRGLRDDLVVSAFEHAGAGALARG